MGVLVVMLSLCAAGLAAGGIHAGPPLATTTTTTTTETTTTTTTDVTTTATTTAPTTTSATTTVATTTAPTTTAPTPKPKPAGKLLTATSLASPRCLLLAGFALLQPGRRPLALGSVAVIPRRPSAGDNGVAYPADGSVLTASSVSLTGSGCGTSARAHAAVGSVSLFGGAATIRSVELGVRNGIAGKSAAVNGVTVGKTVVAALPGRPIVIGPWGYIVALAQPDATQAGALAVHVTKAHAGLAAGTVILIGYAQLAPPMVVPRKVKTAKLTTSAAPPVRKAAPTEKQVRHASKPQAGKKPHKPKKPKRHVRKHRLGDDPLTVTPQLGLTNYAFPVAGVPSYGDTYGGFRGDVPGNWHHGDDIFAPLGTPVVAVADGTLNRVGWERLGGWRLWVRDHNRNQFYYAHLSGYSPLALHSKYVKKGDVVGFIGNSGDAFTTPPHLHFEIHPHQLLKLDYNGAVNPTPYIAGWRHLTKPKAPVPVHPPFPAGPVRREASYIWRELLAARGLTQKAPMAGERPRIAVPHADVESAPRRLAAARRREAASPAVSAVQPRAMSAPDLLAGIVLPAVLFAGALTYRLRRERP
ncbi:MAG: peptidoglycan DD-metalloendopeptidase family protein [Gaiellaceae bacterium]